MNPMRRRKTKERKTPRRMKNDEGSFKCGILADSRFIIHFDNVPKTFIRGQVG
jgi:hypothetical protein